MIGTPILLILILGTVLANVINGTAVIGEIHVLYKNPDPESKVAAHWETFVRQAAASGIHFEQAGADSDGIREVKNNQYVGYVEISDSGVTYYGNTRSRVESGIAQSLITAFADRYKLAQALVGENPGLAGASLADGDRAEYVQVASLVADRQPSAMDYYAIAMVTLIILFGALGGAELIESERKRKTAIRLMASPVSKAEIFTGKITGALLLNMISTVIVVVLCKYMFGVYWGDNLGLVFLVLFTEIVFAISLGIGLSYLLKGKAAGAVVMMIIQLGAFIGGSYFPVVETTGFIRTLTRLSPLEWSNTALLQLIFSDRLSGVLNAMLLNIGFSILLLFIAVFLLRRREGL